MMMMMMMMERGGKSLVEVLGAVVIRTEHYHVSKKLKLPYLTPFDSNHNFIRKERNQNGLVRTNGGDGGGREIREAEENQQLLN